MLHECSFSQAKYAAGCGVGGHRQAIGHHGVMYSLFVMAMRQQRDSDACLRRFSGPATAPPPLPKILAQRSKMTGGMDDSSIVSEKLSA